MKPTWKVIYATFIRESSPMRKKLLSIMGTRYHYSTVVPSHMNDVPFANWNLSRPLGWVESLEPSLQSRLRPNDIHFLSKTVVHYAWTVFDEVCLVWYRNGYGLHSHHSRQQRFGIVPQIFVHYIFDFLLFYVLQTKKIAKTEVWVLERNTLQRPKTC